MSPVLWGQEAGSRASNGTKLGTLNLYREVTSTDGTRKLSLPVGLNARSTPSPRSETNPRNLILKLEQFNQF